MATSLLPEPEPELEPEEPDDDLGRRLSAIVDKLQVEDSTVRDRYIASYKKADYYWRGIFDLAWDSVSRSWITFSGALRTSRELQVDPLEYDKSINIYRAHGESIIAAIATHIPNQVFFPENADSADDIASARAYTDLSKRIAMDNDIALRYIEVVQMLWNYGFAAVYNAFVESEEYGIIEKPVIGLEKRMDTDTVCASCGYVQDPNEPNLGMCPECGDTQMEQVQTESEVPYVQDVLREPDGREVIRVFSPLEVQIPYYVKYAKDLPYIVLETEVHRAKAIGMYPKLRDKLPGTKAVGTDYARRARLDEDALDSTVSTIRQVWLASWTFNLLEEADALELTSKFPKGCYCVFVDDVFVGAIEEDMHDYWTFPESPTSRRLFADPLGKPEMPIQDMVVELTDLTMETIEHGITQTFADPQVVDFKKYGKTRAVPGAIYPVKQAPPGRGLDTAFFQMKSATLSQEVKEFRQYLDYMGQFVVGDLPSIFGGAQEGSRTLGEYTTSQASAMQRLSITARVSSKLWSSVIRKAVIDLRSKMKKDIHYVERMGNSFLNVWIKKEQLTGQVGRVEPETSDLFPLTEAQRREIFMALLTNKNDQLLMFFLHPENIGYAVRLLGFDDLFIPGDRDRNKQLGEIQEMLNSQPEQPPIPVDAEYDDHIAHIQTTRAWLISEVGQATRKINPMGYQRVVYHLMEHMQLQAMQGVMNAPPSDSESDNPGAKSEPGPGDQSV